MANSTGDLMAAMDICSRLRNNRDLAKRLYADNYETIVEPFRKWFRDAVVKQRKPKAEVALDLLKHTGQHGSQSDMFCMIAACCDELEKAS